MGELDRSGAMLEVSGETSPRTSPRTSQVATLTESSVLRSAIGEFILRDRYIPKWSENDSQTASANAPWANEVPRVTNR